jgi:hypothetical protein
MSFYIGLARSYDRAHISLIPTVLRLESRDSLIEGCVWLSLLRPFDGKQLTR